MSTRAPRLDIGAERFKREPFAALRELRNAGPVVRARVPLLGEVQLLTTWEACSEALKSPERFCVDGRNAGRGRFDAFRLPIPRMIRVLADNMLGVDDPDHRRLRDLVEKAFRRSRVEDLRSGIERAADRLLDDVKADATSGGTVDLLARYARQLPLVVISDLLGLPEHDRENFWRWLHPITEDPTAWKFLFGLGGLRRLMRYLQQEFERQRHEPAGGMISALLEVADGDDRLSEDELLSMVVLLLVAGHETTTHLISGGALALLQHREQRDALAADWSQAPAAVGELLRFVSPVQTTKPRYVRESLDFFGVKLERGEVTLPFLAAANCDPKRFDDPERLQLQRAPNPHLGFGTGPHSCLGLQLAHAEAEVAFEHLFERFPHISLACPAAQLRYTSRVGIRALRELPVALG